MEQCIFSRFEFPAISFDYLAEKYNHLPKEFNEDGTQIGGVCMAFAYPHSAILLTYDGESDTYLKYELCNHPNLKYTNLRK